MARQLDVSVMVKLIDRITGPLSALQKRFAAFTALGQKVAGFGRTIGVLGAAVAAISFMAPIQSAAAWDQKLREGVVTAGYWGDEARAQIKSVGAFYNALALQVGLTSNSLADAGNMLIASGMEDHLAKKLLPTIGRVAKAASAVPEDVANVAFVLSKTMGIAVGDMEANLAKLVVAGKLGRFEFKDMAKYIPTLASEFDKLGMKGSEAVATMAASLQIAMFGASDTSAAANNFKNYLAKLLAPETKKRFKDFGVDITGVLADAARKGIDPMEASVQKVMDITGLSQKGIAGMFDANKKLGMDTAQATAATMEQIKKIVGAEKLGALFGDMEVLNFIIPMTANIEKYKEFKAAIASAGLDVIARDYATQWEGLTTQLTISGELVKQAVDRIGLAFAKNLPWINEWGVAALGWVHELDAAYPGLIDQVLSWGGAVLMGVAALAIMAPVISIVSAAFGVLVATGGALLAVLGALFTPIGAVIAALALAAVIIYANWDEFSAYFGEMWDGLKDAAGGFVDFFAGLFRGDWAGVLGGLRRMWNGVKTIASGFGSTLAGLGRHILNGIKSAGGAVIDWLDEKLGTDIRSWPGKVTSTLETGFKGAGAILKNVWETNLKQVKEAFNHLRNWIDGWTNGGLTEALNAAGKKWETLKSKASEVFDGIKGLWRDLVKWVESFVPSFNWPNPMQWFKDKLGTPNAMPDPSGPAFDPMGNPTGGAAGDPSMPGRQGLAPTSPMRGFAPASSRYASAAAVSGQKANAIVSGKIVVEAAPGSRVVTAESGNKSVALVNRGRVVGRV